MSQDLGTEGRKPQAMNPINIHGEGVRAMSARGVLAIAIVLIAGIGCPSPRRRGNWAAAETAAGRDLEAPCDRCSSWQWSMIHQLRYSTSTLPVTFG